MRPARRMGIAASLWILGALACLGQQRTAGPAGPPAAASKSAAPQGEEKKPTEPGNTLIIGEAPAPVPARTRQGFASISEKAAGVFIGFLSSDAIEGRATASNGYDAAAEFVAAQLELSGAAPAGDATGVPPGPGQALQEESRSFFQEVPIKEIIATNGQMTATSTKDSLVRTRSYLADVDYQGGPVGRPESFAAPVVFAGYGIRETSAGWDDYAGLDVKGKIVMVLTEAPGWDDPKSPFGTKDMHEKYGVRRSMRHALPAKAVTARELGAVALLMVENSPDANPDVPARILDARTTDDSKSIVDAGAPRMNLAEPSAPMPWETLPVIRISQEMADSILELAGQKLWSLQGEINQYLKPRSLELEGVLLKVETTAQTRLTRSRNVLGFLEGSDPALKGEVVVIGAHLDHLGKKGEYVFNGADDNGSGCAALLEVARAFAANGARPKRSVLFAFWTGEEEGLLGSRYYADHPRIPMNRTVACLNLDMVGRPWTAERLKRTAAQWGVALPEDALPKIQADRFMVLPLSEDPSMADSLREADRYVGLSLFLRQTKGGGGGSDHTPFAMRGIPWVFFFGSMHDDYHGPADTMDKVSLRQVADVARLAFLAAFQLADK